MRGDLDEKCRTDRGTFRPSHLRGAEVGNSIEERRETDKL